MITNKKVNYYIIYLIIVHQIGIIYIIIIIIIILDKAYKSIELQME